MGTLLLVAIIQVYRFRNVSDPTERQQTKWVLFGLSVFAFGPVGWNYIYGGVSQFAPGQERLLAEIAHTQQVIAELLRQRGAR